MRLAMTRLKLTAILFGSLSFVATIDFSDSNPSEPVMLTIKPPIDRPNPVPLLLQIESTPYNSDPEDIRQVRSGTLSFGREVPVESVSFIGGPVDADYSFCSLVEASLNEDGTIDFARAGEGGGIQLPFTVGEIARSDRASAVLCKAYYINYA